MVSVVRVTLEDGSHDAVRVKLKEVEHVLQPGQTSLYTPEEDYWSLWVWCVR